MLRTIAISLMLLLTVGVMLPFANSAHGVRQSTEVSMRRHHRYHSRAWWRRYRARLRKKRAAAALAHRNAILGQPQNVPVTDVAVNPLANLPAVPTVDAYTSLPSVPANTALPSVSASATAPSLPAAPVRASEVKPPKASEAKVSVRTNVKSTPILPGQMNLSVVALSRPNPVFLTAREESRLLGGTSISDLRRIVIDKMIVSGGWVTNDFVREVNGSRVFVVTARTPRDSRSPEKIWTFYFTEADGRIYGLTTDAPADSADRMSTEAERFINKLHATPQTIQR
jgi:hypothetical protein